MALSPTNSIELTRAFYKGYKAESIIAHCLRQEGYYVFIAADNQERERGGAPGARNGDSFLTMPDLDVARNGYRGFIEVKFKTKSDFTRSTNRKEHGIGLSKWRMYQKIQKEFGVPVLLCIYEGQSGAVLFSALDDLVAPNKSYYLRQRGSVLFYYSDKSDQSPIYRIYKGNQQDRGGMIYFPRSAFGHWGKVAPIGNSVAKQLSFDDLWTIETVEDGDIIFKVLKSS